MHKRPIIFFDSGIGGLPYLSHLKERLPDENYIYVADSKNFPYGEKSSSFLIEAITEAITGIIDKFDPKVIVLACNTASVTALKHLRTLISIPIVGVVPAIKTAAATTKNNKIGILATNRTVEGEYLNNMIDEFSLDKVVFKVGASDIVDFVENRYYKTPKKSIQNYIDNSLVQLKESDVDSVVLGCTHFIHVSKEIKKFLGDGVSVIDSRIGVSNQVERVLISRNNKKSGLDLFYLTKKIKDSSSYIQLCQEAGLEYKGAL